MIVTIKSLLGTAGIPSDRTSASVWMKRNGVPSFEQPSIGGFCHVIDIADLPTKEREAFLSQSLERTCLPAGKYDDEAHKTFLKAPQSARRKAESKAEIARVLVELGSSIKWADREAVLRSKFGPKLPSKVTLKRILSAIKGVDPINYAPALLAGYKATTKTAAMSEKAWSMFLTILRDAGQDFPLIQAWRDIRDLSAQNNWEWPSYVTINRRWNDLPCSQRQALKFGKEVAAKALAQPALRDKTTINAMEWVSLDGRTLDFWTDTGNGRPVRLTMLALIDVASNMVLGYELAPSENASDTVRLIRNVCEKYGIFDRLYTDNGSSFAGHLVAGGNVHKFRKSGTEALKPLGICHHLGIDLTFALPGNAQAKIAERTFASLSRVIDDRPEFKSAHAGHNPGAAPDTKVEPVDLDKAKAVIDREIDRYNSERGRRAQGASGRSYREMFMDGMAQRIVRRPTAKQLHLASLFYKPVAVDRWGRVTVDGWVYGDPTTQDLLLRFHGTGEKVLLGRNPDDLSAPVLAFDDELRLISDEIQYVERGEYDSREGIVTASRNRKAVRKAMAKAEEASNYATDAELRNALSNLPKGTPEPDLPVKVVGGRFGAPLRKAKPADGEIDPRKFYENMDARLAELKASGDKLA